MSTESKTSKAYREHVQWLELQWGWGNEDAARSLSAMALLAQGWRYGDPDPDPDGPDGGETVDLSDGADNEAYNVVLFQKRAA